MLSAFLQDMQSGGSISPKRVSERLKMPLAKLASVARLHRNSLTNADSPSVQDRLGVIVKILAKAAELSGDAGKAVVWFRYQPIPGFDYKTPEELVESGHAGAVLGHLDDLADGLPA